VLWVAGLALVAPLFYVDPDMRGTFLPTLGYTCAALGFACLLLATVTTPEGRGLAGRFLQSRVARGLAAIGVWSYSIYLWHVEVMELFRYLYQGSALARSATVQGWFRPLPWTVVWPVGAALYVAVAIAFGILMARLIEAPALAVRDRWFPSRTRSAMAPGLAAEAIAPAPGSGARVEAAQNIETETVASSAARA
jgi:peptidoglycan/LPS O-acetylase OafA/YrhL